MSFQYAKDVLPNGLRVVTVQMPHLHTALLAMYVRTGSRHETARNNGVSHYLEHLFFRGSERFPDTVAMNAAVEEVGGNLNGVTTRDHGYYYTPIHPDHLEVGMEIIGDMLTRPLLKELEVERQVILEEMLDEVDERGRDIDVDNLSKMAIFKNHPLALKIAGTRQSVQRMRMEHIHEHFAAHYVARNMVFTAAGKVSRAQVVALAEKHFERFAPGAVSSEKAPKRPPSGPWLQFAPHGESQTEFRLNFTAVPEQHADYPALQLLRRVLDDGLSSRLPFNVVEKKGLAYSVGATLEAFDDVGMFEVDAAAAPEKAPKVVEEICRTLGEVCEMGPSEEELARAKRRHRMFLEFAEDSPAELAGYFGATELFRPPESFAERCQLIEAQTVKSVREAARKYLRRKNLGVVAVGQRKGVKAFERVVQAASGLP